MLFFLALLLSITEGNLPIRLKAPPVYVATTVRHLWGRSVGLTRVNDEFDVLMMTRSDELGMPQSEFICTNPIPAVARKLIMFKYSFQEHNLTAAHVEICEGDFARASQLVLFVTSLTTGARFFGYASTKSRNTTHPSTNFSHSRQRTSDVSHFIVASTKLSPLQSCNNLDAVFESQSFISFTIFI
jgi:hypothetical protein